jgi:uncharacterized short protein YbdD (DUF466 family)
MASSSLRATLRTIVHRIVGAPDYDVYIAHMRAHHPAETPLPKKQFFQQRLAERYERPGSRCC